MTNIRRAKIVEYKPMIMDEAVLSPEQKNRFIDAWKAAIPKEGFPTIKPLLKKEKQSILTKIMNFFKKKYKP